MWPDHADMHGGQAFGAFASMAVGDGSGLAPPPAPYGAADGRAGAPFGEFDALGRKAKFGPGETNLGRLLEVHKALWMPVGFAAQAITGNWGVRASLMTGLFGAYGCVWVAKSNIYPDLNFYNGEQAQIKGPADYALKFSSISVYFLYPYLACANPVTLPSAPTLTLAAFGFCLGGFLHWAGDAQRYFQLKSKPGQLITDGFYAHIRRPSYAGEMLMWLSLTLLSGPGMLLSWAPVAWLSLITLAVGIPTKEKSLSRYGKAFADWRATVPALIPRLF